VGAAACERAGAPEREPAPARARDAAVVAPRADAAPPPGPIACAGAVIDLDRVVSGGACRQAERTSGELAVAIAPAVLTARPGARVAGTVEWHNPTAAPQPLDLRVSGDRLVSLKDRISDPTGKVDTRIYPKRGCGSGTIGRPDHVVVDVAPGGRAALRFEVDAVARTFDADCNTVATSPLPPGRYELEIRVDGHRARGHLDVRP
jgi:hypothetical protein